MEQERRILSLFSGCGGLDLGFEGGFKVKQKSVNEHIHPSWISSIEDGWVTLPKTLFKTVFANDILKSAETTWIHNFNRGLKEKVFHTESIVDLVKKAKIGDFKFPDVDVVTGGFPCQDFSLAGKRKGFNSQKSHNGISIDDVEDPTTENRGMLYIWMKEVIELTLPKVFIAENVKGLVSLGDVKSIIEHDFRNIGSGYIVVNAEVLNAKDYGVPQNRERVIFIGLRIDCLTDEARSVYQSDKVGDFYSIYPQKTHGNPDELFAIQTPLKPYVTSGDYLLDLPEPADSMDINQQTYSKARFYGTHCQGNKELDLSLVSPTIRSEHHGNIEFRRLSKENGGKMLEEFKLGFKERRLTVRECARLQTFPDNFGFVMKGPLLNGRKIVSGSEAYKLIGNAVPPLLGYHVASRLSYLWPIIFKE